MEMEIRLMGALLGFHETSLTPIPNLQTLCERQGHQSWNTKIIADFC